MKNVLLTATAIALISNGMLAQAGDVSLGLGAVTFESPYKDFKDDNAAFLIAEYQGEDFSIGTEGLNYRIIGDDESPINLYATLTSTGSGFDSGDSTFFTGMAERDTSIDLGLSISYQLGNGTLNAAWLHDISGSHKGFVADFSYSHLLSFGDYAEFSPAVGINYLSKDYSDYYFGVRNNEATANRAAYKADAAVNPYIGYELLVPLDENWQLIHTANYTWLSSEIKDSSIVNRDNTWMMMLGVTYSF
ncbi:MipA/OmpV family protein [Motiliproteus sp. MSK22-1]|uniref:MipA/OmpV family protein n=1 Tax=Motiliproteus sp. MSK22-1 TaxID=1897630 RepID=UPI000975E323|nr:MipA/OmpV family protein [Motiliproteus sp. MSK22-1]OMH26588.1 hypothetical protein BGP75_23090 [Motiliproteus sp. MSK22-1]